MQWTSKFHCLLKNTHNNEPYIKIFNENEVSLGLDDVTSETNIISILEIQGIKSWLDELKVDITKSNEKNEIDNERNKTKEQSNNMPLRIPKRWLKEQKAGGLR